MFMDIRREKIRVLILEKKSVTVSELAIKFSVSEQTIRRDLKFLENEGYIKTTYGGAILKTRVVSTVENKVLKSILRENKIRIAKKSAEFIYNNDCVFVDFSTTAQAICKEIVDKELTVITNSLDIMTNLAPYENISLVGIGGTYLQSRKCFVNRTAIQTLSNYHVDKAFISCGSVCMEKGLSDGNELTAVIRQQVISNANEVYLLADTSKLDRASFVHISGFEKITAIIVDDELSLEWKKFCKENNIKLYECV